MRITYLAFSFECSRLGGGAADDPGVVSSSTKRRGRNLKPCMMRNDRVASPALAENHLR